jgi:NADH-quinone oxidoreductase subunit C
MADEEQTIEAPSYDDVISLLNGKFSGKFTQRMSTKKNVKAINEKRRIYLTTDRANIHEICSYLHDRLNFEQATSVCGVDYVDHLQVVYHLTNYFTGIMVEIAVDVPNDDPHIQSVSDIWEGANWHERETYELFGIVFDGHPKLERLLTPKTYEFYPFRKSYKLRGQD